MAYDYQGLVNDICQRFNEVQLSASNFASAPGAYAAFKQYVNNAIEDIDMKQHMWPFNWVSYDETLVVGQVRYDYQSGAKIVDFDTFRIQQNDTFGNDTVWLKPINYDEYIRRYSDSEYETSTSIRDTPYRVFKTQKQGYGIYPPPDKAYTLTYEYFSRDTTLSAATDVPTYPSDFRSAIVDGASAYAYRFRGDTEHADRLEMKFKDKVDQLKRIYIPMEDDLVDTRVRRLRGTADNTLDI